jgi:hypothetical protein
MPRPKFRDLSGQKFGRLTVIRRQGRKHGYAAFLCECVCGSFKVAASAFLKNGSVASCGCLAREKEIRSAIAMGKKNRTHGESGTGFYKLFTRIRYRCNNKRCRSYKNYGGRGIQCLWNSFEEFKKDMYQSYILATRLGSQVIQIDRRDNNGNYCKENCRWVSPKENARNRRTNVWITLDGKTQCVADWSLELGIPRMTITRRLQRGWTPTQALSANTQL